MDQSKQKIFNFKPKSIMSGQKPTASVKTRDLQFYKAKLESTESVSVKEENGEVTGSVLLTKPGGKEKENIQITFKMEKGVIYADLSGHGKAIKAEKSSQVWDAFDQFQLRHNAAINSQKSLTSN